MYIYRTWEERTSGYFVTRPSGLSILRYVVIWGPEERVSHEKNCDDNKRDEVECSAKGRRTLGVCKDR